MSTRNLSLWIEIDPIVHFEPFNSEINSGLVNPILMCNWNRFASRKEPFDQELFQWFVQELMEANIGATFSGGFHLKN